MISTEVLLTLVWAGMWRYLILTGHRWLVGCASVPLAPDGALPGSVRAPDHRAARSSAVGRG
jgi:putative hemolysin